MPLRGMMIGMNLRGDRRMAWKRLSKKSVRDYLTYSWWKYLALVIVCVLGVDLLFTMTAYRVPENKKIEVFILNGFPDAQRMEEELWQDLSAAYPEQEELRVQCINILSADMYAYMQFSTYVAAQQGDVCLMPVSEFEKLSAEGAEQGFIELTPYMERGLIDPDDIDLTDGMQRSSEGIEGLYAIPADSLYGLLPLGVDPRDSVLCIFDYNGNDETSAFVLGDMIRRYRTEKPEGYDEPKGGAQTVLF